MDAILINIYPIECYDLYAMAENRGSNTKLQNLAIMDLFYWLIDIQSLPRKEKKLSTNHSFVF